MFYILNAQCKPLKCRVGKIQTWIERWKIYPVAEIASSKCFVDLKIRPPHRSSSLFTNILEISCQLLFKSSVWVEVKTLNGPFNWYHSIVQLLLWSCGCGPVASPNSYYISRSGQRNVYIFCWLMKAIQSLGQQNIPLRLGLCFC